jgi:CRISPR-associated protein Csd1
MILQALYQLAQDEHLVDDPDFEPKAIPWLVRIGRDGSFLGFVSTAFEVREETRKGTKSRFLHRKFPVPRETGRTSGDRAFFFFDKADYVFGLEAVPDPDKPGKPEKIANRFALFRARVRECAEETGDEGARAISAFLDAIAEGDRRITLPEGCTGSDLFAFIYDPDVDQLVWNRPKVNAFWRSIREQETKGEGEAFTCLVTGASVPSIGLFPSIKGVPGGSTSGIALVSFNASAFLSYGLKSNENAPFSRDAGEACATALNRLLSPGWPDPADAERTLPRRNIRITADTAICFWSGGGGEFADCLAGLLEAQPEAVARLYHSIWHGRRPDEEDLSPFYALTLSGTQGRAVVRGWYESTISAVAGNIAGYFADLDIARNTPKPREGELPPAIPLRDLLGSLAPFGKSDAIPDSLAAALTHSAYSGEPFPFALLQRAIERARVEIGKSEWSDLVRRDARAAIIKAVLNRNRRHSIFTSPNFTEVTIAMDPNNRNIGYLLGRLMAVIERVQQVALGDINAGVVDRFFAGASATPMSVFPRLMKNLRHHVRKARDDERASRSVSWLDRQVDAICAGIPIVSDKLVFPRHLDLEQQALFIIGYHHMRNWLWQPRESRADAAPAAAQTETPSPDPEF